MRRAERVQSLEEERSLLRKEERLPRIDHELPGVGLDFREVRVHGAIEREGVGDSPLHSAADLRRRAIVIPPARSWPPGDFLRNRWIHISTSPRVSPVSPSSVPDCGEKGSGGTLGRHPGIFGTGVLNLAHNVEIPALLVARLVLEALERDLDLDLVPVFSEATLRREHEVLAQVRRDASREGRRPSARECLTLFHYRPVHLDAEWVNTEDVRLAVVVKSAEQNLHVVVGCDLVAIGERRVDGAVRLEGPNAEMQCSWRIPDENLRGVGRGNAVVRRELRESGEQISLLPHRLVEHAVHGRFSREPGNTGVQLVVATDVGRGDHQHGEANEQEQGGEHVLFDGDNL